MTITIGRKGAFRALLLVIALIAVACSGDDANAQSKPKDSQKASQSIVEQYQAAAEAAVPYPLAEMQKGGWLERRMLVENLKRQNDPNRIAYVTLLNEQGQPITQFTIQGMVFSLNSQLTTEDKVKDYCGSGCYEHLVTKSPGDNGTWGPEPDGISFFTTEGVQIKWNGLYVESDSPLNLTTKPLIIYDASTAKAPANASGVVDVKNGGIKTGN